MMGTSVFQAVGAWLPTVGLLALAGVGLLLWCVGRKLVRPACAVCGLVLGGLGGWALGQALADQGAWVIPLVVGGGVAGGLLAVLLFRLWMALSGAALLALAIPAAVLIWQGTPPPSADDSAPQRESTRQAAESDKSDEADAADDAEAPAVPFRDLVEAFAKPDAEKKDGAKEGDAADEAPSVGQALETASQAARSWSQKQLEQLGAWWEQMSPGLRSTLYVAGAVGGLTGLLLGLIAPRLTASLQTALVGAILILFSAHRLIAMHAPDQAGYLPQSPRGLLVWVGLITLLGLLFQWTLLRRRTDK